MNTREFRYRKRLEDERHKLVEKAMKTLPNYHPPADYRRPTKTQEKVYVPVNDYPEINFSTRLTPLPPSNIPTHSCPVPSPPLRPDQLAQSTECVEAHRRNCCIAMSLTLTVAFDLPPFDSYTNIACVH